MGKKERPPAKTIDRQPIVPHIDAFDLQGRDVILPKSTSIGLLSTDGLFAGGLLADTQMLIADLINDDDVENDDKQSRVESTLAKLGERHKEFVGRVFKEFDGKYVTVRLSSSLLADLFPRDDEAPDERPDFAKETNPIMGTAGVRIAISCPRIAKMQIESIVGAGVELKVQGYNPKPRIAVPFVSFSKEFNLMRNQIRDALSSHDIKLDIPCGVIICNPRGAIIADELAQSADFLIINTDLLTQMTLGMSRVDTDVDENDVVPAYINKGIFTTNPFDILDTDGVGKFVEMAVQAARKVNPEIEIDIMGSHRGNEAVSLYKRLGVNHLIAPASYWN